MTDKEFIFPQELEVWHILPAIRKELAIQLTQKQGLTQKKTSKILGVTEAAISQYKKEKRASEDILGKETKKEIKKSAQKIKQKPDQAFNEIMRINNHLKKTGKFCKIHKQKSPTPDGCEKVCQKNYFQQEANI